MNHPWDLYDALIDGIPDGPVVDECIIGVNWTFVRSGDRAGIAMTFKGSSDSGLSDGPIVGTRLKDVAAGLKSWNMLRASVGAAACNAWYNAPEEMEKLGVDRSLGSEKTGTGKNIFNEPMDALTGKKVAVIGHFPYIEEQLGSICSLSVLERRPQGNDLLDSACEYILPEQDFVFITGLTLTNKTLPRLLTLTEKATTIIVGPSAPMTPILFGFGVDSVAGYYVTDIEKTRALVSHAAYLEIFRGGRRTVYSR